MKKLFLAALIGLTCLSGIRPDRVEATPTAVQSWKCAGKYYSYQAACNAARYLEACGYCTCIKHANDGCYRVYYK